MNKNNKAPNGILIIGFILLNVLGGIFYRYNDQFRTTTNLYLWFSLVVLGTVILFWGLRAHFASYQ